jgi:hypothetical protein
MENLLSQRCLDGFEWAQWTRLQRWAIHRHWNSHERSRLRGSDGSAGSVIFGSDGQAGKCGIIKLNLIYLGLRLC